MSTQTMQVDTTNIHFRIHFKTAFGESLWLAGDIDELGNWKDFVCPLQWTEGHYWQTTLPVQSSVRFFQYKYVVISDRYSSKKWERGLNRIADIGRLRTEQQTDAPTLEDTWN